MEVEYIFKLPPSQKQHFYKSLHHNHIINFFLNHVFIKNIENQMWLEKRNLSLCVLHIDEQNAKSSLLELKN